MDGYNSNFKIIEDKIKMQRQDRKRIYDSVTSNPMDFDKMHHIMNKNGKNKQYNSNA